MSEQKLGVGLDLSFDNYYKRTANNNLKPIVFKYQ
jgi:hypothetical protein